MAGDWIPATAELPRKREVLAIAAKTGRSRHEVVGLVLEFWIWASSETADGHLVDVHVDALAPLIGADKSFWEAMIEVGWLKDTPSGLFIPNADSWITKGAKSRLLKNKRQQVWRDGKEDVGAHVDGEAPTEASTTEQKIDDDDDARAREWQELEVRFVKAGIAVPAPAVSNCRKIGLTPQQTWGAAGWYRRHNQKAKPGAIQKFLATLDRQAAGEICRELEIPP